MQQQQTVVFAAQNKEQVRALAAYINDENNYAQIQIQRNTTQYKRAVARVKNIMREHFEKFPPQKRVIVCPWKALGTQQMCFAIANKYSVPYWDVAADANPYITTL